LFTVHDPPLGSKPHDVPTHIAGAVHWLAAPTVQVFTQVSVVASQRPGAQFATAGVLHVPVPLQVEGGRRVEAVGHAAGRHWVPAAWNAQAPPAHWPVVPQLVAAVVGHRPPGSAPEFTLVQLPTVPARLQALQAAVQAALQHTPCAQKVLLHSAPAEHEAPFGFKPQLLIIPFMPQMFGVMHWALVVQAVKHLLALQ
jgi:hypothetical protein